LSLPNLEFIDTRVKDNDHVVPPDAFRAAKPPAFTQHAPRPVALHGTRIRTNRYEDDTIKLQAAGDHVDTHSPATVLPALVEDPIDIGSFDDSLAFGKGQSGDGDASASHTP